MKRLTYTDYEEFIYDATEVLETLDAENPSIAFIAKYTEANEIVKTLVSMDYDVVSIDLHKEGFENYFDEYIIKLNSCGIWCYKFKTKNTKNSYLQYEPSVTYVMDNCCSKVLKYCGSDFVYEVCVGEENDEDSAVESTRIDIIRNDIGTPIGFTKSWIFTIDGMSSYSSYTHHNDDVDKLREIAERFGVDLD